MSIIITRPINKLKQDYNKEESSFYSLGEAYGYLAKSAASPSIVHSLAGRLYLSDSGWLLLSVPNALLRGTFDALNEIGAELPLHDDGKLVAHITVMSPDELKQIGGEDKVTEKGHYFNYTLGPLKEVDQPAGQPDISKVWYITVRSTDLEKIRKSYGLSPRPKNNDYDFHITIGRRRRNVLRHNDTMKSSGIMWPAYRLGSVVVDIAGLKHIAGGKKDKEESEADRVIAENALPDNVSSLPTTVPDLTPKKKKKPIIKQAEEQALDGIIAYYTSPGEHFCNLVIS